ncbi:hypothetical protein [Amycolatopsis nigrescens]|uniref:hypothetical protein n=1 Tax=Amycolatopsis nigrescens TaxID=381445 RepID=UPI00036ADB0E|nr:hypothetical protein [Amycolatopsis nigrescens]
MSVSTTFDDGGNDESGEVSRGMAALERHLADAAPEPAAGPDTVPVSKRVRRRRVEQAEAHQLLDLDDDETVFLVASERVRTRRRRVREAGQLWQLDQDPMVLAYRDARMRRLLVTVALVALTLALAWSTAGVQTFAAEGALAWTPRWVFAWLVEPFCSLALLMVVGARAYLAVRGRPLNHRAVRRSEFVFLGLTLGMNAWPHLPWVAETFSVSSLVLHLLGPIVAVTVVTCLPHILAAFTDLSPTPAGDRPVPPSCSANTPTSTTTDGQPSDASDASVAVLTQRVRDLIAAGELRPGAGVRPIRRALRCAMDTATQVRNALHSDRKDQ